MIKRKLIGCLTALLLLGSMVTVGQATGPVANPSNGHTYMTVPAAGLTWDEARAAAEALGGYLATLTSQQEQDFLVASFPEIQLGRWWIGAYQDNADPDADPAGEWRWVTGEPWSYTNWYPGEPNDSVGVEDWGMVWHDGLWNDCVGGCNSLGYIVEFEPGPPPPPPTRQVIINVKPGSNPNGSNMNAEPPVAILTTPEFDATQVDVSSVRFGPREVLDAGGGASPINSHLEDSVELDEHTRDGDIDLLLKFDMQVSGATPDTTEVCVRGVTYGGVQFEGCDAIKINGN